MNTETTATLVEAVKAHALANYGHPTIRWDVLVECWTDDDIAAEIGQARTKAGVIRKITKTVRIYDTV